MNTATLALLFCGFAGVFANDQIWMKLMSARIENAVRYDLSADENIPTLASELGLKTLLNLVKVAGLDKPLSGRGPFTLFGPEDSAFSKLPILFLNVLADNTTLLDIVLKYHVAVDRILSSDLTNDLLVSTLLGQNVRINIYKDGKVVTASGSRILVTDQEASNGVIHEVADVLLPPPGDALFVLTKCPLFGTLLAAVNAIPSIADVLKGNGPFTLFAPPDEAFDKLPNGCLDKLLNDEESLAQLLEYHVVPITGYSAGLSSGDTLKTAEGGIVKVSITGDRIVINQSKVLYADCTATNGVIHVIDRVLFPEELRDFCEEDSLRGNNNKISTWRNLFK